MTPTRIQAILFDFDGTLVDSEALHYRIWTEVLRPWGVALSEAHYKRHHAGMPTAANAIDIVAQFGLAVDPALLADAKSAATQRFLAEQPFPLTAGAREAIAHLKNRGLRLAVVTGAARQGLLPNLQAHGLLDAFETLVCADDVTHGKPAPDCYRLALQRLGLQAADCVAIEDSEHGLAAAHAAGVACLAVPTAMSQHHDFSRATAIVSDLFDAMRWIDRQHAGD